jgi:hypothetical protein
MLNLLPIRVGPLNRRRADIVTSRNRAQRFALHLAPLDRLGLLVPHQTNMGVPKDAHRGYVSPSKS